MKKLVKRLGTASVSSILMLSASQSYAGVSECQCAPEDKAILDCDTLREVVLDAVRNKHQHVRLRQSGNSDQGLQRFKDANKTYKDFLRWTAARDSVTIANLLSKSKRASYDPDSFEAEGYAVSWLNISAVDMEMYYDEFSAEQSGQAVVQSYDAETTSTLAKLD